jgi:hypothetical protein
VPFIFSLLKKLYFMPNEVVAIDPLGKTIYLPRTSYTENEAAEIYDDAATVVEKPALIIEVTENGETQFYYFRSVGWNSTLLIVARFMNERWEAYEFVKNAASELLLSVLKRGKQVF